MTLNCSTGQAKIERALALAKDLDDHLSRDGIVGPLQGCEVSRGRPSEDSCRKDSSHERSSRQMPREALAPNQ